MGSVRWVAVDDELQCGRQALLNRGWCRAYNLAAGLSVGQSRIGFHTLAEISLFGLNMALTGLLSLLGAQPWLQRHLRNLARPSGEASLTINGDHQAVYLSALWHLGRRPVVAVTPRLDDARRLYDQLLTYLGDDGPVFLLPEPEVLPFERLAVDARTGNQRITALAALAEAGQHPGDGPPPLVVASVSAALRLTLPPALALGRHPNGAEKGGWLVKGSRLASIDDKLEAWVQLGYCREPQVERPGTFSLRGGILDIFPPNAELPYRIELWDDEIDTIRVFDPETQRSIDSADAVNVIAAAEQLTELCDARVFEEHRRRIDLSGCSAAAVARFQEELSDLLTRPNPETLCFYNGMLNSHTLADYVPSDAVVAFDRPTRLAGEADEQDTRYEQQRENRQSRGELPYGFPSPSAGWELFREQIARLAVATVDMLRWGADDGPQIVKPLPDTLVGLPAFTEDVASRIGEGGAVVAVSQHAGRLSELLGEAGISASVVDSLPARPRAKRVYLVSGALRKGWQNGSDGRRQAVAVYSDAELFGTVKQRSYRPPPPRRDLGDAVSLADLVPGSYVVHIDHGVARFVGTTHLESGGGREYLTLEYAGDDRLYVPTEQLDRLGAYVAATDHAPALTRLGGSEWQRIKERASGAAREIAAELLRLYATRETVTGHRFGPDAAWQRDLEDSFPYQETPDQLRAAEEVKTDMEMSKPMDRLICGDVGYGKTEVALRAAFKTVNEGMQVAVLVPTTVLAQQHYATFAERLAPYPVKVEVLSRFRTNKEQGEVVAAAKEGAVDIVIGTHRILQKDVGFKNLGLVIVDEEHRFGVGDKERLKQMRAEVDVLTLTATPIPRTLHMALAGVRDMSVIHTAPEERLPVKTFVSEGSGDLVRDAILRELERDGQVFFLHNRVRTIRKVVEELEGLVPEARFIVGHGQMPESELEDVMVSFANREADVMVCTTIIESGLDMPNVNTIIIDRADRFGLAQLYQLRGRVGRGDHRAYAYLLLPDNHEITEAASQRIHAILEANELGSGFRIAMRDLEIRGAGNLLGADQSGQIQAVGLNLYSELVSQAVQELRDEGDGSERLETAPPPRIDLPAVPAAIPSDYIAHLPARLAFYQRLSNITDRGLIADVGSDMKDRFGPLPVVVENLLAVTDLRCLGMAAGVESISGAAGDGIVTVVFHQPVGDAQQALQNKMGPGVRVGRRDMEIRTAGDSDNGLARLGRALRRVIFFVEEMQHAMAAARGTAVMNSDSPASAPMGEDNGGTAKPPRSRTRRRRQAEGVAAD